MREQGGREQSNGWNEIRYHSSREERTAGREAKHPRGGFLKRNRSLAIVLIDVAFVFVVFLLFRFLVAGDPASGRLGVTEFSLEAFEFDREVYVTVTSETADERPFIEDAARVFSVEFPDGREVTDILPTAIGVNVEVRAVFDIDAIDSFEQDRIVAVTITVADERLELNTRVGR
ncbi:MAG: hypothetical protein ACOC8L_13755 [Spirochaetota bacterium]